VVHVAAPAVDGRATEEARRLLADSLGIPRGRVTLRSGARARVKIFEVEGLSDAHIEARIAQDRDER